MDGVERQQFGLYLARTRRAAGLSQSDAATALCRDAGRPTVTRNEVSRWERGIRFPGRWLPAIAGVYGIPLRELEQAAAPARWGGAAVAGGRAAPSTACSAGIDDDAWQSMELADRAAASDVSDGTLIRLEEAVDNLAMRYAVTPPGDLLAEARRCLAYTLRLFDARKTLRQQRRLIVAGGWLSLIGATLHIDVKDDAAAVAELRTARELAEQAEHPELAAWCFETEAWKVLTHGDHQCAVELSRAAQAVAPRGSSAGIQACAQEGRAWARLGETRETYAAINRVNAAVSSMSRPERPEHHYHYDPDKSTSYTATTLAWVGDPAAEEFAREVIARLEPAESGGKWPRRAAVARLDLALALLVTDRLDEACAAAREAIESGRVVPSNHWRAAEVVVAAETRGLPEARDLREAFESLRRRPPSTITA
jgi:transcriptional regulator with XRE-family HTH domain